jgi:hypothetical protein
MQAKTLASRRLLIALCLLVSVVAVAGIGSDVMQRAQSMRLAGTSAGAITAAPSGTQVKAVLRIAEPARQDTFAADVLENVRGADYRATGTRIRLVVLPGTRFIMGAAADVKPGAIVQADGAMDAAQTLRAAKIVVLGDYVHVMR